MSGLRAAEQLVAQGFDGELTVIGEETHMPYNRPPLSKEVLATVRDSTNSSLADWHAGVAFRLRRSVDGVKWTLGRRVTACDLSEKVVRLVDGTTLSFDGLVVATGLRPRRLDLPGPQSGRHVIRSLDDAIALRSQLRPGARVVVVGGGFIGCEIASTAQTLGCDVHIVEPATSPMIRPLGPQLGAALRRLHEASGVRVHTGLTVHAVQENPEVPDRVGGVVLSDGTDLPADVIVESVGSHANVEWLAGNDLDLKDGVLCDNAMRVEGRPDVVAVGDVARFPDPATGNVPERIEHWCIPTETARRAALSLSAHLHGREIDEKPFSPMPSFWSDQFGVRLQGFGSPSAADTIEVLEGDLTAEPNRLAGLVVGYLAKGRLVGVVLISPSPNSARHYREMVEEMRSATAAA